jgi:phosphatidylethanolamine-binding protein (PEBP) family uncharacterized protein
MAAASPNQKQLNTHTSGLFMPSLLLQAAHAPRVTFQGEPAKLTTLLMVDPDAPSPDNPVMAQWLHWLVANIPGERDSSLHGPDWPSHARPTGRAL